MANRISRMFELRNGRNVRIRTAETNDAENLLKLFDTIVSEDQFNVTTTDDVAELKMTVEKEQEWVREHDKDGNLVLVAEIDGAIVGIAGIDNGKRRRIAHVGTLHINVLREFRGLGLGTELLQTAIGWAREDPLIEKIGLGVFATNDRAIQLYKKMAFIEEGRKIKEVKIGPDNYVDSILMYKLIK